MKITIPANKLAEFIRSKTPEERERTVRNTRRGGSGHPTYYTRFKRPACDFLVGGCRDATGIVQVIEDLKERKQSSWYATDSRITTEAFRALIKGAPGIDAFNITFAPFSSTSATKLHLAEADVSVTPNLIVHSQRNGKPLVGALRFYLAKESKYHLGVRGAELVATMQYLWLRQVATGERAPDPEFCMVLECLQQRITRAPASPASHIDAIERGCREFVRLWHFLDEKDAA